MIEFRDDPWDRPISETSTSQWKIANTDEHESVGSDTSSNGRPPKIGPALDN